MGFIFVALSVGCCIFGIILGKNVATAIFHSN